MMCVASKAIKAFKAFEKKMAKQKKKLKHIAWTAQIMDKVSYKVELLYHVFDELIMLFLMLSSATDLLSLLRG